MVNFIPKTTKGMNSIPQISIIMPVYNRKSLINRAIDSIMEQTLTDWELLIIDDGSTDGLESLVFPLVEKHRNIRYSRHSNRGVALTRNLGILAAQGEFITFLDSDDEFKPDHLQLRYNYMKQHPETDLLHGGVELVGPPDTHYVQDAFDPNKKIHLSECYIGATIFGKKAVMQHEGGFKALPYSSESEFIPRIMKHFTVNKVNYPTYIYYTGLEDSICTRKQKGKNNRS